MWPTRRAPKKRVKGACLVSWSVDILLPSPPWVDTTCGFFSLLPLVMDTFGDGAVTPPSPFSSLRALTLVPRKTPRQPNHTKGPFALSDQTNGNFI